MLKQQLLLMEHFKQLGGQLSGQTFEVRHPQTGAPVKMTNLVVEWHPERKERILLCAHYDTRPFPDRDRQKPEYYAHVPSPPPDSCAVKHNATDTE